MTSKLSLGFTTLFTFYGPVQRSWASFGCAPFLASTALDSCNSTGSPDFKRIPQLYRCYTRRDVRKLDAPPRVAAEGLPTSPVLPQVTATGHPHRSRGVGLYKFRLRRYQSKGRRTAFMQPPPKPHRRSFERAHGLPACSRCTRSATGIDAPPRRKKTLSLGCYEARRADRSIAVSINQLD